MKGGNNGLLGTVLTLAAVGAGIYLIWKFANKAGDQFVANLGLGNSSQLDGLLADPANALDPSYWATHGSGSVTLNSSDVDRWIDQIKSSLGVFTDDFGTIMGVFHHLPTKEHVSLFADDFKTSTGWDLQNCLKNGLPGTFLPWNGLSDMQMTELLQYIQKLPE